MCFEGGGLKKQRFTEDLRKSISECEISNGEQKRIKDKLLKKLVEVFWAMGMFH